MASIKLKFRPSNIPDHEGTLYFQILQDRKPRQLLTSYHLFPSEWDAVHSALAIAPESPRRRQLLYLRERLRWDLERLSKIVRSFDARGLPYTAEEVVEEFHRYEQEYSLFNYMEGLIARMKRNGKLRTSETYRSALNSFKSFRRQEDIMLDCLCSEDMEAYEAWQKGRGNSSNTISFYTRILRAVYRRAVEEGIVTDRNPFRHVYTGVDKTLKRALTLAVIKRINALDLSTTPALDLARDIFMLSFMLRGMSFIDMAFLRKSDLTYGHIVYRRRKTGQRLSIKWTADMQRILDKYPENETDYLLPIIRNKECNEYYAYKNMAYIINYNLKKVGALLGLPLPLTLYVARHSWASIARAKGIPVSVISEGMGHDSEQTTQIYLATLDTSAVDRANNLILKSL